MYTSRCIHEGVIDEKEKNLRTLVTTEAWKDPAFKKRFLANPKAALTEMGYKIAENVNIRAFEDTRNTINFVLPVSPVRGEELSDAELERISAAGEDTICQCSFIITC